MKNLFTLLSIAVTLLFIQACDQAVSTQEYAESKNSASIDFVIVDVTTNTEIDSAMITWFIDGKHSVAYTDSTGRMTITGLPAGIYSFTIEKSGYAAMIQSANLSSVGETEMPVLADIDLTVPMHATTVTLSGIVKVQDTDNNKTAKAGVVVDLVLPSESGFKNKTFSTVTDSIGGYTFTNLPERVESYIVSTRRVEIAGFNYQPLQIDTLVDLKPYEVIAMDPTALLIDAPDLIVDSWVQNIVTTEALVLNFSDAIDIDKIKLNNISVTNNNGNLIATNYSFSPDSKQLSITPAMGDWGTIGLYTVKLTLTSIHGDNLQNLEKDFSVINTDLPADVTGFVADLGTDTTINYYSQSISLKWNEVPNVLGYEIYKKRTGDANFTYVSTYNNETTNATISSGLNFENAAETSFMIVSFNHNTTSSFTTAPLVTFNDVIVPTMSYIGGSAINSNGMYLDNSAFTIKDSIGSGKSGFSDGSEWTLVGDEDIDTTAVVTVGFKSHPDALGVDWRWERDINNNMNIRAWITVGPESDASGILVDTISIKGLTDISENMRTTPIEIEVLF